MLVVPRSRAGPILETYHNVGHFDADRTRKRLINCYWWYGLPSDVTKFVKNCTACAECKITGGATSTVGKLPSPGPFELVFLDIVILPSCRGYQYLLTMECSFTRWVEAIPLTSITAEAVATAFLHHWVFRFGPPVSVHSDRGTQFESELFSSLCNLIGIAKSRTTAYHPEGNGALERFHRTLKTRLVTALNGRTSWMERVHAALFAYRTSVHSATGLTPFQLVFGFTPAIPADWPD